MKSLTLHVAATFIFFSLNAQITFQKIFGGDYITSAGGASGFVQQTTDGGYIIAGKAMVWSGPTPYLIKTDANGDTLWTKIFITPVSNYGGGSVHQTRDGGYLLSDWLGSEVYLIKTDPIGDTIWTKTFEGSGNSVPQTDDGGYIIAGGTSSFGAGGIDVSLIKTDSSGNAVWSKTFGGTNDDLASSVQQTKDGGYIIIGKTLGFGAGGSDIYLIKTDSNGIAVWSKTFGGTLNDEGYSVQQTSDDGYIITGITEYTISYTSNCFLIKTDANGDTLWTKTYSAPAGHSVQQTNDGGYILSGYENMGNSPYFVVKTDTIGNIMWSRGFDDYPPTSFFPIESSVRQTNDGGYIIAAAGGEVNIWLIYLIKTDSNGNSGCIDTSMVTIVPTPALSVSSPVSTVTMASAVTLTPAINVSNVTGTTVDTLCYINALPSLTYYSGGVLNLALPSARGSSDALIINDGNAASGAFSLGFFASTDTVISTSDFLLGDTLFPGLSPGNDTVNAQISFDLCTISGLTDGVYYIGFIIDYLNDVTEQYEVDNYYIGSSVIFTVRHPFAFNVTPSSGFSCQNNGNGVLISLSDSETGVEYQLMRGTVSIGSPVTGTGGAITFGYHTQAGVYEVVATDTISGCATLMGGTTVITQVTCDDGDACTTDGCDTTGGCTATPILCDDGDPCTADTCINGVCQPGASLTDSTFESRTSCDPADTGVVTQTFTNQYGCDSVHTITTTLDLVSTSNQSITDCDSVTINGTTYYASTTFSDTIAGGSVDGCDSVINYTVTINQSDATFESRTSCDPADTGVVVQTLTNQYGCDSVHTITTTLDLVSTSNQSITACDSVTINGTTYYASTTFSDTITGGSANGCDSMINYTVTINQSDATFENRTSCNPADTGVVVQTLTNQYGCDSVHTIATTLSSVSSSNQNITDCDSTIINGTTYYASTTFSDTIVGGSVNGCDSVINYNVTINQSDATFEDRTSCNPADTGVVVLNLINQYGCDSVHTIITSLIFCDDGDLCTTDNCVNGVCNYTSIHGCDSCRVDITGESFTEVCANALYQVESASPSFVYEWIVNGLLDTAHQSWWNVQCWADTGTAIVIVVVSNPGVPSCRDSDTLAVSIYCNDPCPSLPCNDFCVTSAFDLNRFLPSQGWNLYPNPNNGSFQIKIDDIQITDAVELEVYNIVGERILHSTTPPSNTISLNMALDAGLYILQLRINGEAHRKRFVVMKQE